MNESQPSVTEYCHVVSIAVAVSKLSDIRECYGIDTISFDTIMTTIAIFLSWIQISSLYLKRHLWPRPRPRPHRVRPRPRNFFFGLGLHLGLGLVVSSLGLFWLRPRTSLASLTALLPCCLDSGHIIKMMQLQILISYNCNWLIPRIINSKLKLS